MADLPSAPAIVQPPAPACEGRQQYTHKIELMLSLVGYAVGLGNLWRFPYLTYTNGGGAFLIPYFLALFFLGLPLFVLELGLGQMFRQGTIGVWQVLGLPRLRGVGAAAVICSFVVNLYYNVIIAWTIYYLARTVHGVFSGVLPWADTVDGFSCPDSVLFPKSAVVGNPYIYDKQTGLFNRSHILDFWCPTNVLSTDISPAPAGHTHLMVKAASCPAWAAVQFWEKQVLQQSSGMDDLGGLHWGLVLSHTAAWLLVYFCIFKGIASSGKVVYVTATLPYVALTAFFFRAVTLPNALQGIKFFLEPNFGMLLNTGVWLQAVTQIFYSLGVACGALIAFGSYSKKESNFVSDATTVSFINCGTSVFGGFVVFPILAFLAHELAEINPCIRQDDLNSLASIGLSGTGLAFIAFPIAISQMPGGFFWALLFFIMLLCLGIDSQFATVEGVITVFQDAGFGSGLSRPATAAIYCSVSYILGLIFMTRGGIYWFQLFDNYSCVVILLFVGGMECVGMMWFDCAVWPKFVKQVELWTGRKLSSLFKILWRFVCPVLFAFLIVLAFTKWDIMDAQSSTRYPGGTGYYPAWSVWVGWSIGLVPLAGFIFCLFFEGEVVAPKSSNLTSESSCSNVGDQRSTPRIVGPSGEA